MTTISDVINEFMWNVVEIVQEEDFDVVASKAQLDNLEADVIGDIKDILLRITK